MWLRPGLAMKARRLVTVACVAIQHAPIPIMSHVHAALKSSDISFDEMNEVALHFAADRHIGPVVSVIKFGDEAEAVRIANDSSYGLNAFVQTRDLRPAHRLARRLEAGSVWINRFSDISPQGPYGGFKPSGFGRTGGREGLYEFMQVKNVRIGMS